MNSRMNKTTKSPEQIKVQVHWNEIATKGLKALALTTLFLLIAA